MTAVSFRNSSQKWNNLTSQRGELSEIDLLCALCGGFHATRDHWQFMATMPSDPADMIDDLIKMRLYKEDACQLADTISQAELRKQLFLKSVSRGDPSREKLVNDLLEEELRKE